MRINTTYIAEDGHEFKTKEECLEWEKHGYFAELCYPFMDENDVPLFIARFLKQYVIARKKRNGQA